MIKLVFRVLSACLLALALSTQASFTYTVTHDASLECTSGKDAIVGIRSFNVAAGSMLTIKDDSDISLDLKRLGTITIQQTTSHCANDSCHYASSVQANESLTLSLLDKPSDGSIIYLTGLTTHSRIGDLSAEPLLRCHARIPLQRV